MLLFKISLKRLEIWCTSHIFMVGFCLLRLESPWLLYTVKRAAQTFITFLLLCSSWKTKSYRSGPTWVFCEPFHEHTAPNTKVIRSEWVKSKLSCRLMHTHSCCPLLWFPRSHSFSGSRRTELLLFTAYINSLCRKTPHTHASIHKPLRVSLTHTDMQTWVLSFDHSRRLIKWVELYHTIYSKFKGWQMPKSYWEMIDSALIYHYNDNRPTDS